MDSNPFAPPNAPVADIPAETAVTDTPFFAVGIAKLVALVICTGGLYEIYWFYRNWKAIQQREAPDIYPFWRAVFAVFFIFDCMVRMREYGNRHGIAGPPAAGPLATGWIITSLCVRLPDPYSLIGFFVPALFLMPVQAYVNRINASAAPTHDPNRRLTGWNWLTLVVGGILIAAVTLGILLLPKAAH